MLNTNFDAIVPMVCTAAGALVGDDGEGGARKALTGSANTMHAAKDKLTDAAGMLAGLAGELDKIPGIGGWPTGPARLRCREPAGSVRDPGHRRRRVEGPRYEAVRVRWLGENSPGLARNRWVRRSV